MQGLIDATVAMLALSNGQLWLRSLTGLMIMFVFGKMDGSGKMGLSGRLPGA